MRLINNTSSTGEVHFQLEERKIFGRIHEVIPSSDISTTNRVETESMIEDTHGRSPSRV